jgi:hypothetical protein
MADGPRRDAVIDTRSRILAASITEARHLSNLSLHMQSSRAGSPRPRSATGGWSCRSQIASPDRSIIGGSSPTDEGRDAATADLSCTIADSL